MPLERDSQSQQIQTSSNVSYRPTNILPMADFERAENDYMLPIELETHRTNSGLDTEIQEPMNQANAEENTAMSGGDVDGSAAKDVTYAVVDKRKKHKNGEQSTEEGLPDPFYSTVQESVTIGGGGTTTGNVVDTDGYQQPNEWVTETHYQNVSGDNSTGVTYAVVDKSKRKKKKDPMDDIDSGVEGPPIPPYNPSWHGESGCDKIPCTRAQMDRGANADEIPPPVPQKIDDNIRPPAKTKSKYS